MAELAKAPKELDVKASQWPWLSSFRAFSSLNQRFFFFSKEQQVQGSLKDVHFATIHLKHVAFSAPK